MLIAQLSDPHLRPPGVLYQGLVDSNAMFEAALRHLAARSPAPDLVLLSGDVTDEGTAAEYALARDMLAGLRQPLLVIPGNHDEREAFRASFADRGYCSESGPLHAVADRHGPVRVIALDVTVPDAHHGVFDDAAARWLEAALAAAPERPTIVMLHQPPLLSGIPYIDIYRCRGARRLAAIIERYPSVERVVTGHIHRFMLRRFAGTILCTAPSTTTAIALGLEPEAQEASYIEPPALLLHHWTAEAGMVTHLVPIGDFPGPLPFA